MLAGGLMMLLAGLVRGEFSSSSPRGRRPHWCISRRSAPSAGFVAHLCAPAPRGVVCLALRIHQPGDCGGPGRVADGRAVRSANGHGCGAGVCGGRDCAWKSTQPALETVVSPQGKGSRQPAGRRPYCAGVLSVRGPSAKVMVPSHTTSPSTRQSRAEGPFGCAAGDERLDHDLITRVDRTPIANALDAHEVNQLLAVLGLRRPRSARPARPLPSESSAAGQAGPCRRRSGAARSA